jgi:hypothetical protein
MESAPPATTDDVDRGGAAFPRSAARALRRGLERGARHGAGAYLHDDLRRFRAADHRPARIAGGFDGRPAGRGDYVPTLDTTGRWRRPNT